MVSIVGFEVPTPDVNITGFISSTWIYVFIVLVFGFIAITTLILVLFFLTYNRKVVFFENISGQGFQPTLKRRARIIKLGLGGEELLKILGGDYMTAYGRKMGKNTFWFAKGQDGYWYNFLMGDLDAKMGILDIEPVDKDVRMFHVAKDRLNKETYGKKGFLEKFGIHMLMFAFLIVLILGMWFIIGKIGEATESLSRTAETNVRVAEQTSNTLSALANIQSPITSGVIPADEVG